jgi:hypothetical protein
MFLKNFSFEGIYTSMDHPDLLENKKYKKIIYNKNNKKILESHGYASACIIQKVHDRPKQ